MTIGERIRQLRIRKGLTQKELGQISETAETTVRQYENNKRQPKIEQIEKLAKALEVSPADIMGWDYFDKKFDINKIKDDIKVINYLESIGYTIQWDMRVTEWEVNPDGSKYPVTYDKTPDAPYCTLIKKGTHSTFTNQQFEKFQAAIKEDVEVHIWKKNKGK